MKVATPGLVPGVFILACLWRTGGEKNHAALARSTSPLALRSMHDLATLARTPNITTAILFDRNQFAFQVNC
ncbi:hypothetical protein EN41_07940 [Agrobacterium tumefaciens]|jgi:hypothetical protein|uniref:Uncharacterized protein n=1 Tax=Agrobacterium fabrum TaxID=1176649 RepID=A0A7Z7FNB9_9HYPH|nr:hypothetical protein EN41_07940 [Agrobacterium tumefaciens]QRM58387.1 hypothetical protein F3P66_02275 [Agrobacterium fabrum]TRB29153.1 hypothetical protein EXN51_11450 [Agrobacterium fabrum]WJK73245.1 hypothetical protein QOV31_000128 [Agrobacterium fabrum]CAD0209260.1 hypothetical protein AGTUEHA105_LOCUS2046 [Agrobacterium tumefaciens]